jgi:drug/metabolite transporter (DMT)-like permease
MEKKQPSFRIEYLLMLITTFFWALGHPVGRILLKHVHPFQLGAVNLVIGFLCLFLFLTLTGNVKKLFSMSGRDIMFSFVLGVFGFFLYQILTFSALVRIPASMNAILVSTNVVFIALLSALILKERIFLIKILGILLAFIGVVIITFNRGFALESRVSLIGCCFSILAAISFALYSIFGKKVLERNDPLHVSTFAILSGAVLLSILTAFTSGFYKLEVAGKSTWLLMVMLSVTMIGIAYPLWFSCLKGMQASHVSIYIYMTPVFAVILSLIILDERFAWLFWLGAACVLGGIVITTVFTRKIKAASTQSK